MSTLWISLLELRALPGTDDEGEQAFTNGIVLANSAQEAEQRLRELASQVGWQVVRAEDTEELSARRAAFQVSDEILSIARLARRNKQGVFGSFYVWGDAENAPGVMQPDAEADS